MTNCQQNKSPQPASPTSRSIYCIVSATWQDGNSTHMPRYGRQGNCRYYSVSTPPAAPTFHRHVGRYRPNTDLPQRSACIRVSRLRWVAPPPFGAIASPFPGSFGGHSRSFIGRGLAWRGQGWIETFSLDPSFSSSPSRLSTPLTPLPALEAMPPAPFWFHARGVISTDHRLPSKSRSETLGADTCSFGRSPISRLQASPARYLQNDALR